MDEQEGTNLHTTTTEAITSLLTLRQLRAKIFAQLSLSDQRPLRLVCRDWDKTVLQVRPNMSTVRVMCLFNLEAWGHFFLHRANNTRAYDITKMEDLLNILQNHPNVYDLDIVGPGNQIFTAPEDLTARFTLLEKLVVLQFKRFVLSPKIFDALKELPQLAWIRFRKCTLSGENLGCLGESIREISFLGCRSTKWAHLLEAMKIFHTRGIPLEKLELELNYDSTTLPLMQFMLENFSSLRFLNVYADSSNDLPVVPDPFKQMLSVNIEELYINVAHWPSRSYYRQFFETLLAQPLPQLQLVWYNDYSNFLLEDDIEQRFWDMSPKLEKITINTTWCDNVEDIIPTYYTYDGFNYDSDSDAELERYEPKLIITRPGTDVNHN